MTISTISPFADNTSDQQIWHSLKGAIASSSGFQRWQLEKSLATVLPTAMEGSLDQQVRLYLRETLETLAY
jgi:hypothetical protein